ncbi:MAG: GNAT family N-acetyltransferase, partial [Clostridiaceae bacterium]|nr:GNAT family N-acetyltransferase [Clostridiaceae bacterium]
PPYDERMTRKFLEGFCIKEKRALAVIHKEDRKLIGYALFSDRLEADVYEIGWIFNKDYWRKGLAYEAMNALIEYAFTELGAHKVFAEAIDDVKSVGLMKKLGMSHEGTQKQQMRDQDGQWRDLHFYGLLGDERRSGRSDVR